MTQRNYSRPIASRALPTSSRACLTSSRAFLTSSRACEGSPEGGMVLNSGDPSQARDDVRKARDEVRKARDDVRQVWDDVRVVTQPLVMGILNLTPDSFSDGGRYLQLDAALRRVLEMVEEGASVIDIGGESARPGATPVSVQEELDRTMPVIEAIQRETSVLLSVDTTKPEVMRAALALDVWMINDIQALRAPGALEIVAASTANVCLMHMQGDVSNMQHNPLYPMGVVEEIQDFFKERLQACGGAGIAKERLWLDPGFGFGKTLTHNVTLLKQIQTFLSFDVPLMIGVSRKSMLGELVHQAVEKRLYAGLAVAAFAMLQGVRLIRTHDVRPTCELLQVLAAIT